MVLLILILAAGKAEAQSQVWYVDSSNSGVTGTSWDEAFTDLQEALLVALPGDEIRVAGGSYRPDSGAGLIPGDPATRFVLPAGVSLLGGYAGALASDPDQRAGNRHHDRDDPDHVTLNERQRWILAYLHSPSRLFISDVVARFGCSRVTAKRDLADLRRRELIEFDGGPGTGHWRLRSRRSSRAP